MRGRIVSLLRGESGTAKELSSGLELADAAARARLPSPERDELIRRSGTQRGRRKPQFAYELTAEAGRLSPKSMTPCSTDCSPR
jgi:predicted ArsR family transcriptional regulator